MTRGKVRAKEERVASRWVGRLCESPTRLPAIASYRPAFSVRSSIMTRSSHWPQLAIHVLEPASDRAVGRLVSVDGR